MASEAGEAKILEKTTMTSKFGDWFSKGKANIAGKIHSLKGKATAFKGEGKVGDATAAAALEGKVGGDATTATTGVLEGKGAENNLSTALIQGKANGSSDWKIAGLIVVPISLAAVCAGWYWYLKPEQKDKLLKMLRIKK